MKRLLIAFAAVALLAGCTMAYDHSTATQQKFLQDRYECVRNAGTGFNFAGSYGSSCVQGFSQCLAAKGYMENPGGGRLVVPRGQAVRVCN